MATSSINHVFVVNDPKKADAFVDSLDKESQKTRKPHSYSGRLVTDQAEIRKLLNRRIRRK